MTVKGRSRFSAGTQVQANETGHVVLIKQYTIHAGTVHPGLGINKGKVGSATRLTNLPRPGYRNFQQVHCFRQDLCSVKNEGVKTETEDFLSDDLKRYANEQI